MTNLFANSLDVLNCWKKAMGPSLVSFGAFLDEHDLVDSAGRELIATLGEQFLNEKLTVAFVAEYSRDKSELINAILFADTGRRVLPAASELGTTCPIELGYDSAEPPVLSLLPIESRRDSMSLTELRADTRSWTRVRLLGSSPSQLAGALAEIGHSKWVSQSEARALGFFDEDCTESSLPADANGRVAIPVWRYAILNYPHPLLRRGLVVLDTPGLNTLGAEPELTLSLLPGADATVFVLAADAGVTASDMAIWRDYVAARGVLHVAVLDKIETQRDQSLTPDDVDGRIENLRQDTAHTLQLPVDYVFALSAREALIARVEGDALALERSRLLDLETALGTLLLHQQRKLLSVMLSDCVHQLHAMATRRLGERRRQIAEKLLELRGLRGKSGAKVQAMLQRVDMESAEFEQCHERLQALRSVHSRMAKEGLVGLTSEKLGDEVAYMQQEAGTSLLHFGAKKSFVSMCARLQDAVSVAQASAKEIRAMLDGSFARLNAEFGFGLALPREPDLTRAMRELALIERNYIQYLGPAHALRLSQPKFKDEFRRMLLTKLRVVFEAASRSLELWNKAASDQMDSQLRERQRNFKKRHEALEKVQSATGELEGRIGAIAAQDVQTQQLLAYLAKLAEGVLQQAPTGQMDDEATSTSANHDTVPSGLDENYEARRESAAA